MIRFLLAFFASLPILQAAIPVIPLPVDVRQRQGECVIQPGAFAAVPMEAHEYFLSTLKGAGADLRLAPADAGCIVQFLSQDALPDRYPIPEGEGYVLRITPEVINVHAATHQGHLNGLHTLAQLFEGHRPDHGGPPVLPAMDIVDHPRFGYRGFMLDESRHFTGPAALRRLLDAMARYKLNRLHWHLTDSPAWRIEIKAFPELTRIGGRGSEHDQSPDAPAQFYTQEQIREIIAYARQRGILIIPEIDMPGHADAAVRAYPEHDGGGYLQKGSTEKWPRFTFNPAKTATLDFLDTILREVAELFPDAGILHFGGDEVHFGWHHWPKIPEVQDLMKRENFSELAQVEAWFNRRMAGTIQKLGMKTGGWDEITARDLPTDQTVIYWWRHDRQDVLQTALEKGYPVVLCPRRPCYFDFVQHDSHLVGRRWGGYNPLSDVYAFPDSLKLSAENESRVLGIQACLWTEATISQARRDFMTWPRLAALAEATWTPAKRKEFACFETRLKPELDWLSRHGIQPYNPFTNSPEVTDEGAKVEYLDNE